MSIFSNHGTKLLGTATTIVGALGALDPTVLADTFGQKGVGVLTGIAGILTILRGFQNSANQPPK